MSTANSTRPTIVLLFSGKRKCGKDYLAEALLNRLGPERAQIIRISEPIKRFWAEQMGLDLRELLGDSAYKERYRKQMIEWSDARRREDYGVFCRAACGSIERDVCIVSDVRRRTDVDFFRRTFGTERVRTVRIEASETTRASRDWQYQAGVDDVQSECDLDEFGQWDLRMPNDGTEDAGELVKRLLAFVEENCKLLTRNTTQSP